MSFVTTQPEALAAAAGSLQGIGSALNAQNALRRLPRRGWSRRPPMKCRR